MTASRDVKHRMVAHSAPPSRATHLWKVARALIPSKMRVVVRRVGQYVHSRNLREDDVLLLSYPKSGSTWLRTMIAHTQAGIEVPADRLALWVPPIHMARSEAQVAPRVVRSHDSLNTPGFGTAEKKIVLVRDPRALVTSFSAHEARRVRGKSVRNAASLLLSDGFNDLGSWKTHILALKSKIDKEKIHVVRYEDLKALPDVELSKIMDFIGISVEDEIIRQSIIWAQPDRMRHRRMEDGLENWESGESDIRNVSAVKWREECPADVQKLLCSRLGPELEFLGYEQ